MMIPHPAVVLIASVLFQYHAVFSSELVGSYSTHGRRGREAKQNQDTGVVRRDQSPYSL